MQIGAGLHLVLGGPGPIAESDPLDCSAFLVETSMGAALFDTGAGRRPEALKALLRDLPKLAFCFLTHAHADHAGGGWILDELGAPIAAGARTRKIVEEGDEAAMSLDRAKRAGIYPSNFRFRPFKVARTLEPGEVVTLGDTTVEALATPGHCADHLFYLVRGPNLAAFVAGDALFDSGRVVLQDIWDCSVADTCQSVRLIAAQTFETFLPGHGPFSLADGHRHARTALARVERLLAPELFL